MTTYTSFRSVLRSSKFQNLYTEWSSKFFQVLEPIWGELGIIPNSRAGRKVYMRTCISLGSVLRCFSFQSHVFLHIFHILLIFLHISYIFPHISLIFSYSHLFSSHFFIFSTYFFLFPTYFRIFPILFHIFLILSSYFFIFLHVFFISLHIFFIWGLRNFPEYDVINGWGYSRWPGVWEKRMALRKDMQYVKSYETKDEIWHII